jgi:methyltransferase (TIGR00027 family)
MARSDDDTWDITESVGATALGIAAARAAETRSDAPLISDPFAQVFLDAAGEGTWHFYGTDEIHQDLPEFANRMQHLRHYAASRTKFFDDFFTAAADAGIRQAVILAAGLDSRAWRLPWADGVVVYEIDQPQVLAFKQTTLEDHGDTPRARYIPVAVDLRHDWPKALRDSGFDPAAPSAWSVEGLLPYLPADAQDLLFERVAALCAPGSRIAVEAFGEHFFDPENLERQREQRQRYMAAAAEAGHTLPDPSQLWYLEPRTDVADWLREKGWHTDTVPARKLMARFNREPPADAEPGPPMTSFVEARL